MTTLRSDPPRLFAGGSDAPEELRSLLVAAREDGPSREQLSRLESRLGPLFGAALVGAAVGGAVGASGAAAGGTGAGALGSGVAAASGALAAKIAGGALLAVAVGIGGYALMRGGSDAPEAASGSLAQAQPQPAEALPASPEVADAPAPPSAAAPSEPEPTGVAAPPKPAPGPTPKQTADAPAATGSPRSEVEMLYDARDALKANPAKAFALAERHRSAYPTGGLAQEREVIAIEALSRLGRRDEAKRRAEGFALRYPGSVHRRKVESLVQ
jgi:hypothetical protein